MKIITYLLLITQITSKLILTTENEKQQFGDTLIPYKIFPLLQYPFGRKLYGFLHYQKSDGCSKLKIISDYKPKDFPYFLLLEDINCNFHIKAINAQNAKAELIIIITNKGINKKNINSYNNSFYSKISNLHIPVLLINLKIGEKLKKILSQNGDFPIEFTTPLPTKNNVHIEIYLYHKNLFFQQFLYGLKGIFTKFENHLKIQFFLFKSGEEKRDKEIAEFQIVINCMDKDIFVGHMASFSYCMDYLSNINLSISDCFLKVVRDSNLEEYENTLKCKLEKIKDVFEVEEEMPLVNDVNKHSSVFIDDSVFSGPFDRSHFVNAICSNFEISPVNCIFNNNKYEVTKDYVKKGKKELYVKRKKFFVINVIVFILLALFAGFCLFVIFKKIYRQKLREKVELVVEKSVKDYYAKNKSINNS